MVETGDGPEDLLMAGCRRLPADRADASGGFDLVCGGDRTGLFADVASAVASGHGGLGAFHQEGLFAITLQNTPPARVACHIQNRRIHSRIAQRLRLFPGNAARLMHQRTVPCATDADWRWERRCLCMVQPVDALIGEIDGNAQAGLFDKPFLYLVDGLHVIAERINQLGITPRTASDAVQLFVDIGNSVFPHLLFPACRR